MSKKKEPYFFYEKTQVFTMKQTEYVSEYRGKLFISVNLEHKIRLPGKKETFF